jgi:tetratricopeptide (TPR) repeat protein
LTKEAIQAYKRAVKINPADAESLSLLGRLYTRLGESLDVAAVLCEQSVRLSPDDGHFRHRLGHVYLKQGKLDHALAEFELAVALGHDSQNADRSNAGPHDGCQGLLRIPNEGLTPPTEIVYKAIFVLIVRFCR